jgi:starch synthase
MRILLASSEVHPYSKTGGLADMAGALAKYLAAAGQEVGIVTPLYRGLREKLPGLERLGMKLSLPLGREMVDGEVLAFRPHKALTLYFIDSPDFYDRPALYHEGGHDYADNAERFIFLSKAVVHLARNLDWKAEVVHVHDWQVALVPLLIQHQQSLDGWANVPRTCLTIHNLAYQGVFPLWKYQLTNLPWSYFTPQGVEFYGQMNCLKAGIVYADYLTTVSPRYAREITTEEMGCGLDGVLRDRQASLVGILNGVDYTEWNTLQNPHLPQPYSVEDLSGKSAAKGQLQAQMGLPRLEKVPLFGTVSRLVDQKGMDILLPALEEMLGASMQFVLLGSGDPRFEHAFIQLAARHPDQVAVKIGYDHALSHRIEAGCDFFLMPSRFEPCGLNQMYSLRYGTIPIVRATGGLDDSVVAPNEDVATADGIKFYEYSARALARAIRKALVVHEHRNVLELFRENAMTVDFSWTRTAQEYLALFEKLIGGSPGRLP